MSLLIKGITNVYTQRLTLYREFMETIVIVIEEVIIHMISPWKCAQQWLLYWTLLLVECIQSDKVVFCYTVNMLFTRGVFCLISVFIFDTCPSQ